MFRYLFSFLLMAGAIIAQDAFIKNGDSEAYVRERLGPPTQAGGSGIRKTLLYGKSKIVFHDGKVVSFYPSELKRELAKIRKKGHPEPNLREKETPVEIKPSNDSDGSPTLADLKIERKKLLNDYRARISSAIGKTHRGLEVIHRRREVKSADEVRLNQLAEEYELTPQKISRGFKGFGGAVRVDRKLEGDMAIVSAGEQSASLLAIGFGLVDTPLGKEGVLGLFKENGTYIETVGDDKGREFIIIEPILSQSTYRGHVELRANGLESVKHPDGPKADSE